MCRTGAGSRCEVEESRHGSGEFRGRRSPRSIHHDHKVGIGRHNERIRYVRNRCAQTDYAAITEIILAEIRWIIAVYIGGTLDVPLAAKISIDRNSETCIRGTIISEVIRLVELPSREAAT